MADLRETTEHQAYMLAHLAHMIGARTIVEAGTYKGATAFALGVVNRYAAVHTFDPHDHGVGWMPHNVHVHRCDFLWMLEYVDDVDFAYIDATDAEHGTRYRWECADAVLDLLNPRGIIAFDDTWTDWDGVDEIRGLCQINIQAQKGLSIYQKPE